MGKGHISLNYSVLHCYNVFIFQSKHKNPIRDIWDVLALNQKSGKILIVNKIVKSKPFRSAGIL